MAELYDINFTQGSAEDLNRQLGRTVKTTGLPAAEKDALTNEYGGSQAVKQGQGLQFQYAPSQAAPQPASTPPTEAPTAANGFGSRPSQPGQALDPSQSQQPSQPSELETLIQNRYQQSQDVKGPEAIRQETLDRYKQELDAIDALYADISAKAAREGENRLGQQRAIAQRGGLIGSARGGAQRENVVGYNQEVMQGIAAEKAARIASVFDRANSAAADEIARENEAKRAGADQYIQFLQQKEDRARETAAPVIASLIQQDIGLEEMSREQIEDLAGRLGISVGDFATIYQGETKSRQEAQAEQLKKEQAERDKFILENNIKSRYYSIDGVSIIDGLTGKRWNSKEDFIAEGMPVDAQVTVVASPQDEVKDASIREYEYYKKQEEQAGRTPLSYDQYQYREANRKAKSSGSSSKVKTPDQKVGDLIDEYWDDMDFNFTDDKGNVKAGKGLTREQLVDRIYARLGGDVSVQDIEEIVYSDVPNVNFEYN